MNFTDLTDTLFHFKCQLSEDKCEHWDYDLLVETWDDKYVRNLSRPEILHLRENCNRILQALSQLPRRGK